MKVLLHTCCGPCFIYPAKKLKEEGNSVTGFFYNPNIFPAEEYKRRKDALAQINTKDVIFPDYAPSEFEQAVKDNLETPGRCFRCFSLRLERTAQFAKENGFDGFTTTLLVSPYQDLELIKNIGEEIAGKLNLVFHFENFRSGFSQAHKEAKAQGIYCQKYCGCRFSESEQCKKSPK